MKYDRDIALKYIRKLLEQYNIDGLSSQRFSRRDQKGIGEAILAGSCTSIAALYRDVYGIRPKWNRFGLEPDIAEMLDGTTFNYMLRDKVYNVHLRNSEFSIATPGFSISDKKGFGADIRENILYYFPGNREKTGMTVTGTPGMPVNIEIHNWDREKIKWRMNSVDAYRFELHDLNPGGIYTLSVDGAVSGSYPADDYGSVRFEYKCSNPSVFEFIK